MSDELDSVERQTARLRATVRDYEPLCLGSDKTGLTAGFKEFTFRAAEQGYLPAQACYLATVSRLQLTSPESSQSVDANRYKQYAPKFYSNALLRAYSPLVINATFRWIAMPRDYQSFEDLVSPPDAYLTWRSLRVVYYRVDESQRAIARRWLQALSERGGLSGEDEIRGDEWARDFVAASSELGQPLNIEVPRPMCPLE